jgi:single-stranded-DNA-specific exonuclease
VEGLNITAAISAQKDLLLNFGGHPMAAGLALNQEDLPEFTRRLFNTVERMLGQAAREEPVLKIDALLDLPGINFELAEIIESLAPFGPGNEKLVFASHDLTLQSSSMIGRNQDHIKLTVADQGGNLQSVLWWNGAGESLPQGKFDLAYSLRASDWRGSRQLQVEFVDFRLLEIPQVEIKSEKPAIVDLRNIIDPHSRLTQFHDQPSTLIWAEAEAKMEVSGKDRNELEHADNLVIWTIPPSPRELEAALEIVKPRVVTLVGAHPFLEITDAFLARLIGLIKFALNHHDGRINYTTLAAATAQRLTTVEQGLNWLVSSGKISLLRQEDDQLWLASGKTINDLGGAARLRMEVQTLLAESAAYRAHFMRADKDTLLP